MIPELPRCSPRCRVQFERKAGEQTSDQLVAPLLVGVAPVEGPGVARVNRGAPRKPHQVSVRGARQ